MFFLNTLWAQPKSLVATRISEKIVVDGQLDEPIWQRAPRATGFVQEAPNPGADASQNTIVRVLYDDQAVYVGAQLFDVDPDSIFNQLTERDRVGITDWFAVVIDAYQDGQNGVGFLVTPAGIQVDIKYSLVGGGGGGPGGPVFSGERSWDAVWKSNARITPDGWVAEIAIPYSAIRFPNVKEQTWNINFGRMVRRLRQVSFWNPVLPQVEGFLNQSGTITNISDIKSPVRLSATPFIVGYLEHLHDQEANPANSWGQAINGGMDVKYGINDAFTLDMTLIPDFGQTRSDNQVLNLSPFEVRFDENRPFFTEGTELFNKGDLFYSRRVGGRPLYYDEVEDQLSEQEEITNNPLESRLYNATKLSGRTNGGLGIGFFNATSRATNAKIKNLETGATRSFETNPLTNYNVLVLDQNLKNNSAVTLVNTNVLRSGAAYDANVTAGLFNIRNKANSVQVGGGVGLSQKYLHRDDTYFQKGDSVGLGYAMQLEVQKISGQFQYGAEYSVDSRHWDTNDLGFLFRPNVQFWGGNARYNIFKPFGIFNSMRFSGSVGYSRLENPDAFADFGVELNYFAVTKSFFAFGVWTYLEPVLTRDYFEPRRDDYSLYYEFPTSNNIGAWVSSDYRKIFAYDLNVNYRFFDDANRYRFNVFFSPRYRVNDHLSFIADLNSRTFHDDVGYVDEVDETVIMGRRDVQTFENILNTRYIFNNKMSVVFRVRHYWSVAKYKSFWALGTDGLLHDTSYDSFSDNSFTAFNIDMEYRWRFAPGSDLFFVWKNAISEWTNDEPTIQYDYGNSLSRLGDIAQTNSFSVKVIYFLDYLDVVR